MQSPPELAPWLTPSTTISGSGKYRHSHIKEDTVSRDAGIANLKQYVSHLHGIGKDYVRKLAGVSLDPFGTPDVDPAAGYPEQLTMITLKGYMGEIMAGIYAQKNGPHGLDTWEVPVFPFVFHDLAFFQIDHYIQSGQKPKNIPGQHGEDCLAFIRGDDNRIHKCLVCESKCSAGHSSNLVSNAHRNLSRSDAKPNSLSRYIEILARSEDPTATAWIDALRQLWIGGLPDNYERYDLVLYISGKTSSRKHSWVPSDKPHSTYTSTRKLEAVEIWISKVDEMIRKIYDKP